MLTLHHGGDEYPLQNTEYYIRELANGLDEVIFSLDIHDPIYAILAEEENIVDRAGQTYKVKQIDAGAHDAKIICQSDIDAWRSSLLVDYNSGTKTVVQQIEAVLPAGWSVVDRAHINIGRTIEGDYTPYEICVRCTEVYSVYVRWNNKTKICTIYPKTMAEPVGAFATKELNLKEINYKGKSNDLVTRLYAYGKDGMSFADINGGKAYVDNNTYESRVICGIWRDERYTVKADLLADAQKKLETMSKPERTYQCSIVDLQATNPELYNNLDFSLFTTATLIDDVKETAVDYQVVERHIYPYHPDRNEVIFNSEPLKITASVVNIIDSLDNPSSTFNQIQAQRIAAATNWLLSGDGYVVAIKDDNTGEWKELLFMDTNDIATAQKVLRINENGIGFSTTGANGPYRNAWTIDGQLVADFITTGTMMANRIRGGYLELGGWNNEDGSMIICVNSDLQSGTWTSGTVWVPVGVSQTGRAMSATVDIVVSNIANVNTYKGKYTVYHTTDGGSTWTEITNGELKNGTTTIVGLIVSANSNDYYTVGITQYSGGTSTFNYLVRCNKAFASIDNAGINVNNKFIVDSAGKMTASEVDVTGGKLCGLNVDYSEKGLSFNDKISNIDHYFKLTAWGGITCGRQNGSSTAPWTRMDYVQQYGLLKVDYGNSSYEHRGIIVTNAGNNTYNNPGAHYTKMSYNDFWSSDNGSVAWAGSDRKLKKNIIDLALDKAKQLINSVRPREFEFKNRQGKRYGFIAQELREALDDNSGIEYESNRTRNINYSDFIAPLCMIVKEQQSEIDMLKAEIEKIKERIN